MWQVKWGIWPMAEPVQASVFIMSSILSYYSPLVKGRGQISYFIFPEVQYINSLTVRTPWCAPNVLLCIRRKSHSELCIILSSELRLWQVRDMGVLICCAVNLLRTGHMYWIFSSGLLCSQNTAPIKAVTSSLGWHHSLFITKLNTNITEYL